MKRKFPVFHAALLLALLISVLPGRAAATQTGAQLILEADKAAYTHGDTVKVWIRADQTISNYGMGITLFYDGDVLTPDVAASSAPAPLSVHAPIDVNGETALRVSCFPAAQMNTFSSDGYLAELVFTAKAPVEAAAIRMTAVHQYRPSVEAAPAQELSFAVAAIPVTGIKLDKSQMTLEIEKTGTLHATITPEKASDDTFLWASDNEAVATVKDGTVTAVGTGTAAITATTKDGGFTATCTVTVVFPPDAGYIANMPGTKSASVGTPVKISPVILNEEKDVYNAFDFTLSYDPGKLQLILPEQTEEGLKITTTRISLTESRAHVVRYGEDVTVQETGTSPFDLEFIPRVTGETTVTLVEARVDHSENAIVENAAKATVLPTKKRTPIIIGGYRVTLDSAFRTEGQLEVAPDGTFEFVPNSQHMEYDFSASTMGEAQRPVSYEKTEDGDVIIHFGIPTENLTEFVAPDPGRAFLIPNVTGELVIEAESRGRSYSVVIDGSASDAFDGATKATYGEDYVLIQTGTGSFTTPIIKVNDTPVDWEITKSVNDAEKNVYIIDGDDITSDFTITINGQSGGDPGDDGDDPSDPSGPSDPDDSDSFTVTAVGSGIALSATTASDAQDYVFKLENEDGYDYAWKVKVGGRYITSRVTYDEDIGSYVIPKDLITGNITIEANREAKSFAVSVSAATAIKSDVTAPATATYATDYEFKVTKKTGYTYTVTVTIGGVEYKGCTEDNGTYTIPGEAITGKVVIKVTRTTASSSTGSGGTTSSSGNNSSSSKKTVTVAFAGSCAGEVDGSKTATQGRDYTFKITQQPGFRYDITVKIGDKEVKPTYDGQKGEYVVAAKDVTGNMVITVEKTSIVEVTEYITLDGRCLFLAAYYGDVPKGQLPQYDGNNMFWSESYKAYVWLVESSLTDEQMYAEAVDSISFGKGDTAAAVNYSGNADLSSTIDLYDARLVLDMYRTKYDLENLEIQKLLAADVTGDKRVNVLDSLSIATGVLQREKGGTVSE